MTTVTKPGKYGTLFLYEIAYTDRPERDDGQPYYSGTQRTWAYSIEHAVEKFYNAEDADGWRATSIRRVPRSGLMHRAPEHTL